MDEENISEVIIDGDGNGYEASIVESSTLPGIFGIVVLQPDGSNL